MENKKLTLEDLKLESFLTEIDNSKLVKVQGGNGAYNDASENGDCPTGEDYCDTPGGSDYCPSEADPNCKSDVAGCPESMYGPDCQTLNSNECDTRDTSEGCN